MSNHTPGPWTACDNNGYSIWRIFSRQYRAESESYTVAEVVGDSAETIANGRLIAAAPEMLELIRLVVDLKGRHYDHPYNELTGLVWRMDEVTDLATALLAKIEGGEDGRE